LEFVSKEFFVFWAKSSKFLRVNLSSLKLGVSELTKDSEEADVVMTEEPWKALG
jgi:hypothetical protein